MPKRISISNVMPRHFADCGRSTAQAREVDGAGAGAWGAAAARGPGADTGRGENKGAGGEA